MQKHLKIAISILKREKMVALIYVSLQPKSKEAIVFI